MKTALLKELLFLTIFTNAAGLKEDQAVSVLARSRINEILETENDL